MATYTSVTDNVTDNLATYHNELITGLQKIEGPQGWLQNGYLSRTVASNNLTLAVKTIAGTDPTSTDPVTVRIGNSMRQITAALSVTVSAGSDTFGFGASGALTDQDLFAYFGWRAASSTVFIAASRLAHGRLYSDFSATATNERYLTYSGSAPASTDEVENAGRFNVTTSGSASYNWSVPATSVVISRPIFETRRLSWTPTHSRTTTGYTNQPTVSDAYYQVVSNRVILFERHSQNATPGGSGNQTLTLPFNNVFSVSQTLNLINASTGVSFIGILIASSSTLILYKYDGTAEATASQIYIMEGFLLL